jgi:hypothetical protein
VKRAAQLFVFFVCVFVSGGALWNVMNDDYEVEQTATKIACDGDAKCNAQKTADERTPLARTFTFVTSKRKVDVRCARAYVFAGSYACALR